MGLAQYEALFRDNAVDFEVLPELTKLPISSSSVFRLDIESGFSRRSGSLGEFLRPLTRNPYRRRARLLSHLAPAMTRSAVLSR